MNTKYTNTEKIGYVNQIIDTYGYIVSKKSGKRYDFRINSETEDLQVGDKVIFIDNKYSYQDQVSALRKVFVNEKGISFYPRFNQHHIHLSLDEFLPDIINKVQNTELDFIEIEHHFSNVIGKTSCVTVDDSDHILYAKRKGRDGFTKFVKNREPVECNSIFAVFKRTSFGYLIITIFIGEKAGREPWDNYATEEDVRFWENHALIYNKNEIIRGTERSLCPWN